MPFPACCTQSSYLRVHGLYSKYSYCMQYPVCCAQCSYHPVLICSVLHSTASYCIQYSFLHTVPNAPAILFHEVYSTIIRSRTAPCVVYAMLLRTSLYHAVYCTVICKATVNSFWLLYQILLLCSTMQYTVPQATVYAVPRFLYLWLLQYLSVSCLIQCIYVVTVYSTMHAVPKAPISPFHVVLYSAYNAVLYHDVGTHTHNTNL